MISAIVLAPDAWGGDELATDRERIARSMVWLVSAVVAGVVRDVVLAVPAGFGLSDLAEQSGCELVQAETETERLAEAVRICREPSALVLKVGVQPDDDGLVAEIDAAVRRGAPTGSVLLRERPTRLLERLVPQWAPIAGVIVPTTGAGGARTFRQLVGTARRGGALTLQARLRPIL